MDERFFNSSIDDNVTSSWNVSSLSREGSTLSSDQLYTCNLYKFVTSGIIQLIITIVGFVGKFSYGKSNNLKQPTASRREVI